MPWRWQHIGVIRSSQKHAPVTYIVNVAQWMSRVSHAPQFTTIVLHSRLLAAFLTVPQLTDYLMVSVCFNNLLYVFYIRIQYMRIQKHDSNATRLQIEGRNIQKWICVQWSVLVIKKTSNRLMCVYISMNTSICIFAAQVGMSSAELEG